MAREGEGGGNGVRFVSLKYSSCAFCAALYRLATCLVAKQRAAISSAPASSFFLFRVTFPPYIPVDVRKAIKKKLYRSNGVMLSRNGALRSRFSLVTLRKRRVIFHSVKECTPRFRLPLPLFSFYFFGTRIIGSRKTTRA